MAVNHDWGRYRSADLHNYVPLWLAHRAAALLLAMIMQAHASYDYLQGALLQQPCAMLLRRYPRFWSAVPMCVAY